MKMNCKDNKMKYRGIYLILDRKLAKNRSYKEIIEKTYKFGVSIVQLREKNIETGEFIKIAKQLAKFCKKLNVTFIVNDRVDVALASNADGVHLGQEDMTVEDARKLLGKEKIIGLSAGTEAELQYALKQNIDYLGVGPVFGTTTKNDAGNEIGVEFVKYVQEKTKIPVIPIGGIDSTNVKQLKEIGIECVAVISSILKRTDLEQATKEFGF